MKKINNYIQEKLKLNKKIILKNGKQPTKKTLFPKNWSQLFNIILEEIRKNGNNCSLNHIDVSEVKNLGHLFAFDTTKDWNGDISEWEPKECVEMCGIFFNSAFDGDISDWDVSNVKYMNDAFKNSRFDGDLSRWNVSNVTNMNNMFDNSKFTGKNGSINDWDVSKVELMEQMFRNSDFVGDISSWKIDTYSCTGGMFKNCDIPKKNKPKSLQNKK